MKRHIQRNVATNSSSGLLADPGPTEENDPELNIWFAIQPLGHHARVLSASTNETQLSHRVETEIDPSACEAAFCACSVLLQFESGSLSFSLLCRRVECEGLI